MDETLTKADTLSTVSVENSEMPYGSLICDFACHSPENLINFNLKIVGIP